MIAKMLDLSTYHVPEAIRCGLDKFSTSVGRLRSLEHEHGYIVFVSPGLEEDEDEGRSIPSWLRPIHDAAVAADCVLVNFDSDAEVDPQFRLYE